MNDVARKISEGEAPAFRQIRLPPKMSREERRQKALSDWAKFKTEEGSASQDVFHINKIASALLGQLALVGENIPEAEVDAAVIRLNRLCAVKKIEKLKSAMTFVCHVLPDNNDVVWTRESSGRNQFEIIPATASRPQGDDNRRSLSFCNGKNGLSESELFFRNYARGPKSFKDLLFEQMRIGNLDFSVEILELTRNADMLARRYMAQKAASGCIKECKLP